MEELYTAAEIAERFRIHPETVRRLGREGKIARVKCGNAVRFPMPKEEGVENAYRKIEG